MADYGKTISLIERHMYEREKANDEARTMTEEELQAEVLRLAKEIEARRDGNTQ